MHEVNGFFLFELGQVSLLTSLPPNVDLSPSLSLLVNNRDNFRGFSETKENQRDLPTAVDDAKDLVRLLDQIIARTPPSMTVNDRGTMTYRLVMFRDRLARELGKVYSFVLDEKGGRSVKTLWTDVLALIDDAVRTHLSNFVCENIQEAGKAWVVDRPTAVGFHMMRAVEQVLREYKTLITGQGYSWVDKRGTTQYQGFGTLIGDLERKLDDLKRSRHSFGRLEFAIGILKPLSKLYRDPLSHPELNKLDEVDAKLAFEQGIAAINTMVRDAVDGGSHFLTAFAAGGQF